MSIRSKLETLLTTADTVTGQPDTDLTHAIQHLKDGYLSDDKKETRTLTLDMASGNQTITPSSPDKVMTSVTIEKPVTMLPENIKKDIVIGGVTGTIVQSLPEEVSTVAGMDAVLIAANVGKVYKFTGTTDSNYTNGDIYVVESGA